MKIRSYDLLSNDLAKWGQMIKSRIIAKDKTVKNFAQRTNRPRTFVSSILCGRVVLNEKQREELERDLGERVFTTQAKKRPSRTAALLAFLFVLGVGASAHAAQPQWTGVVVHHTAGPCTYGPKEIDRDHRENRGFDQIGYHFVVDCDGIVHEGRPLTKSGAHARTGKPYSRNSSHIGIALMGTDHFSNEQIDALQGLIDQLAKVWPIESVERHHNECPGPAVAVESLETHRRYVAAHNH